jgi:hypothetical protein
LFLDDKWRKSYAAFLNLWCSHVQELESIIDKAVDDDTKRIWLTNTLQSHKEMNNAIRQAITTELTLSGINGTASTLPWDDTYNMVLSTEKLLGNAAPKPKEQQCQANATQQQQGGQGNGKQKCRGRGGGGQNNQNGGRGGGHNNGQNGGTKPPIQYTKYTGPKMSMAAPMIFTSEDWKNKLTQAQRDKLKELKIRVKSQTLTIIALLLPLTMQMRLNLHYYSPLLFQYLILTCIKCYPTLTRVHLHRSMQFIAPILSIV